MVNKDSEDVLDLSGKLLSVDGTSLTIIKRAGVNNKQGQAGDLGKGGKVAGSNGVEPAGERPAVKDGEKPAGERPAVKDGEKPAGERPIRGEMPQESDQQIETEDVTISISEDVEIMKVSKDSQENITINQLEIGGIIYVWKNAKGEITRIVQNADSPMGR